MPKKDHIIHARELSSMIIQNAPAHDQRTGQYLFNMMQEEVCREIAGKIWDPFNRDMNQDQIIEWLEKHVIFNEAGDIIGLFNRNDILWERGY